MLTVIKAINNFLFNIQTIDTQLLKQVANDQLLWSISLIFGRPWIHDILRIVVHKREFDLLLEEHNKFFNGDINSNSIEIAIKIFEYWFNNHMIKSKCCKYKNIKYLYIFHPYRQQLYVLKSKYMTYIDQNEYFNEHTNQLVKLQKLLSKFVRNASFLTCIEDHKVLLADRTGSFDHTYFNSDLTKQRSTHIDVSIVKNGLDSDILKFTAFTAEENMHNLRISLDNFKLLSFEEKNMILSNEHFVNLCKWTNCGWIIKYL